MVKFANEMVLITNPWSYETPILPILFQDCTRLLCLQRVLNMREREREDIVRVCVCVCMCVCVRAHEIERRYGA
jgi:hypothetical protein